MRDIAGGLLLIDVKEGPENSTVVCDVCIVGAGAAGITIALELAVAGIDVVLLESGGIPAEPDTQELYAGSVTDERMHSEPIRYRQRVLGGTTSIWGGRCMPFDRIDFEARDYVPASGWPFSYDELSPFYPKANRICEAGDFLYDATAAFPRPLAPMIRGFDADHFTANTLERFSCPTNFGARYRHKLESLQHLRVLLHANVTAIRLDTDGRRVRQITARALNEKSVTVNAQRYILATGGLEVPRLLLANRDVQPNGIGNTHDLVGRYYMCHIAGTIGRLQFNGPIGNVHHGYDVADDGVYCRRRLALRDGTQRDQKLGNFVARLHHPRITQPEHRNAVLSLLYLSKFLIPYEYGKRLHGDDAGSFGDYLRHARNVITGPFDAAGFAWHMLRDRKLAERKFPSIIIRSKANLFSLDFHAEQQPNPTSRVMLSDRLDVLGMPQIAVDWRYTPGDVDTVTRALKLLQDDVRGSGVGSFDYQPETVEEEMTRYGAYGGHHIGTARMGNDPKSSVVNADGRLHDVENLYVAGAATFPTSSQANPTLTIVAMALRLASHLRGQAA